MPSLEEVPSSRAGIRGLSVGLGVFGVGVLAAKLVMWAVWRAKLQEGYWMGEQVLKT